MEKSKETKAQTSTLHFFLFVSSSYLVTSTLAKYLHELGHATIAFILGVPISSMNIIVNPFGSGYFRPIRFGFPTSTSENVLFTISGAIFPILVLFLVYLATKRGGQMARWLIGMLLGYSLLSNAVNLVSGVLTRSSDGGYLVSLGLPMFWLITICLLMGGFGALVLIRNNFKIIVLSVQGFARRIVVFSGFLMPSILGLALASVLGDSFRRRLFFSSCEAFLLGSLFLVALLLARRQEAGQKQETLQSIPISTWMVLMSATILSGFSIVLYAISRIAKT